MGNTTTKENNNNYRQITCTKVPKQLVNNNILRIIGGKFDRNGVYDANLSNDNEQVRCLKRSKNNTNDNILRIIGNTFDKNSSKTDTFDDNETIDLILTEDFFNRVSHKTAPNSDRLNSIIRIVQQYGGFDENINEHNFDHDNERNYDENMNVNDEYNYNRDMGREYGSDMDWENNNEIENIINDINLSDNHDMYEENNDELYLGSNNHDGTNLYNNMAGGHTFSPTSSFDKNYDQEHNVFDNHYLSNLKFGGNYFRDDISATDTDYDNFVIQDGNNISDDVTTSSFGQVIPFYTTTDSDIKYGGNEPHPYISTRRF